VELQGLRVAVERNKQGQLNLAQLFARGKPRRQPPNLPSRRTSRAGSCITPR
jgi:hypothetical protein